LIKRFFFVVHLSSRWHTPCNLGPSKPCVDAREWTKQPAVKVTALTRRSAVDGIRKERRGFASMSPEKQREIASKGGRAAHEKGTAHEWTADEARAAGRKGGQISRGGRGRLVPSGDPAEVSTAGVVPASGMEPGRVD
jgi:general stress protein YciG